MAFRSLAIEGIANLPSAPEAAVVPPVANEGSPVAISVLNRCHDKRQDDWPIVAGSEASIPDRGSSNSLRKMIEC